MPINLLYFKKYINYIYFLTIYYFEYISLFMSLIKFIKNQRRLNKMTQQDLAEKAGVGIHFVRDLEQGKRTLRMDKVNQVLSLFGKELGPVGKQRESGEE